MRIRLAEGARVESLGDEGWVAYGALSGETLQLNIEAAALIEVLADGPMDEADVCDALARDTGADPDVVRAAMGDVWHELIRAGLVRRVHEAADTAPA